MNPRTFVSAALVALALAGTVSAKIYELPRSTSTTPVQALITCNAPLCEVAEHCARYDAWDYVTDADFSKEWTLDRNQAVKTPLRASGNLMCAISIREGSTNIRTLRYYRRKDESENWVYLSMTRDWGLREIMSAQAPATEYDFYQIVKGQRACLNGCDEEYVYFDASFLYGSTELITSSFTHFAPGEGTLKGEWGYEKSTDTTGSLTLNYYGADGNFSYTCWVTLTFQTDESGTYDATCNDDDNTNEEGEWIVTGR